MRILDTRAMGWQNGLDAIATMAPEWRENLGPADQLAACYSKYDQKSLRLDADTTRRLDLIRLAPGYQDLTFAFHDSVEECFCIEGSCILGGEGTIHAEGYFWRPPGWIHAAHAPDGFTALLGLQGVCDESGPVTRRIRPDSEAGTNALHPDDPDAAIGPRGWVRMLDSRTVAWQAGPQFLRGQGPFEGATIDRLAVKILSRNPASGAQTLLVRLDPGFRLERGSHSAAVEWFILEGSISIGDTTLGAGCYVRRDAAEVAGPITSDGARLYMKVDGWLDHRCG